MNIARIEIFVDWTTGRRRMQILEMLSLHTDVGPEVRPGILQMECRLACSGLFSEPCTIFVGGLYRRLALLLSQVIFAIPFFFLENQANKKCLARIKFPTFVPNSKY